MNINNINDIQKAIQYGIIPISDACVQEIENMKRKA